MGFQDITCLSIEPYVDYRNGDASKMNCLHNESLASRSLMFILTLWESFTQRRWPSSMIVASMRQLFNHLRASTQSLMNLPYLSRYSGLVIRVAMNFDFAPPTHLLANQQSISKGILTSYNTYVNTIPKMCFSNPLKGSAADHELTTTQPAHPVSSDQQINHNGSSTLPPTYQAAKNPTARRVDNAEIIGYASPDERRMKEEQRLKLLENTGGGTEGPGLGGTGFGLTVHS